MKIVEWQARVLWSALGSGKAFGLTWDQLSLERQKYYIKQIEKVVNGKEAEDGS